jgi:hypothetical protein
MSIVHDFLANQYGYELITEPYTPKKVQSAYLVFPLEKLYGRTAQDLDLKFKGGPLKQVMDRNLQVVTYVYGLEKTENKNYRVHLIRALNKAEYVTTILKIFPKETKIHRYPVKGRNERFLLSRRIFVTLGGEKSSDFTFFSDDQRLLDVIFKKDPRLYTKKDLTKAKRDKFPNHGSQRK